MDAPDFSPSTASCRPHVSAPRQSDDLAAHARRLAATSLHELFAREPTRASALALDWNDWRIVVSKERIDEAALDALLGAAEAANLPDWMRQHAR